MKSDLGGLHYVDAYKATDSIKSFDVARQYYAGPGMMSFEVKPQVNKKILECIDGQISNRPKTSANEIRCANMEERDTITGPMDVVDYEYQRDEYNNIIQDTILELALVYMKTCFPGVVDSSQQLQVDSSWYVYMNAGDYHTPHQHSDSQISGAIYLDINTNEINQENYPDGCIRWFIPNVGFDKGPGENGVCSDIFQAYYIPRSGTSWAWPARVLHLTCPFRGNTVRKMISFNCSVKDEHGGGMTHVRNPAR